MARDVNEALDPDSRPNEASNTRAAFNEARRRKRKSRGQGLRRTTGCLTCKRRHLKCDEATPVCGHCVKSKQTCLYAAPHSQPSTRHAEDSETTIPSEIQVAQLESLPSPIETRHTDGATSSPATIARTLSRNSDRPAPTPPDAAFYRWFGLLADDAAIADANDPSLSLWAPPAGAAGANTPQSFINGLSVKTFRERYAIPSAVAPCLSLASSTESTSRHSWHGTEPAQLSRDELVLFQNFVVKISAWLDIHDPLNSFSALVPRLALHDAGLMSAILALSSRQLSIKPDASDHMRDRSIGLQYYHNTLSYLQQAMSFDAYTVSLELLATALIVSMYEMLEDSDSGSGWGRHLKGVFWIQRSQLIQGETGGLRSAVWWAWLRQDIWAAFREGRKTLSFWTPTKSYPTMTCHEKAARVVWIFAKAVDYCSDEEVAAGRDNTQTRVERADAIFDMLNEWERNLSDEFVPLPTAVDPTLPDNFQPLWVHPPEFGISLQLYHAARILVLLHKPSLGGIREYAQRHKLMTTAASTICQFATLLNTTTLSLMSSQCLYIAGLSFQNIEQRERVVILIDDCYRTIGWPRRSLSEDLRVEWAKLDAV